MANQSSTARSNRIVRLPSSQSSQPRWGIRGGRLTKLAGMVASFAPAVSGSAKAFLLSTASFVGVLAGAFLGLTADEARAACTEAPSGTWTCTDTTTEPVSIVHAGSINVNLASNFVLDSNTSGLFLSQSSSSPPGISLTQSASGGDIRGRNGNGIEASAVVGDGGPVSINVNGIVSGLGLGNDGIRVSSQRGVTVTAGTVTGGQNGIYARQRDGIGSFSISASGRVIGTTDFGIYAKTGSSSAGSLTVTAERVRGFKAGIRAVASGMGAVSIKASGAVRGTTEAGIKVNSYASTTDMTIDVAAVTGRSGIDARHGGSGTLDIKASGSVSGTGAEGIFGLVSSSSGGSLTITAAAVTGSGIGIKATSSGTGVVSVNATGAVTGTATAGVQARGGANTGTMTINVATVTGAGGIDAQNTGSGLVTITATGTVTGSSAVGILGSGGGAVTITAAAVAGGTAGIRASGSGAVNVNASAEVTATGAAAGIGIDGTASGAGALTITAAAVTGSGIGIKVVSSGAGTVSVIATGAVTGTGTAGIQATGGNTTGAMAINVATVTGKTGIDAEQGSANALNVTAGAVTGTGASGVGIYALVSSAGALAITAAAVTGSAVGIKAISSGAGTVSVRATGAVLATGAGGIGVQAQTSGGALTISAAAVTGTSTGIQVKGFGTGSVSISASGAVTGTGDDGIFVDHDGSGATTITVSTAVTGGTTAGKAAIRTDVSTGGATILLNSGASVGAAGRNAIIDTVGNATVTVNTGASITGKVNLGSGNDTLTISGGSFSSVTEMKGGAGTDTLTFSGGASGAMSGVAEWETVSIRSGSTVSFGTGTHTLGVGTLTVASGGTLNVGDDSDIGDDLTVSGNFAGGGTVTLDANFGSSNSGSDNLTISGNVTGATTVNLSRIGSGDMTATNSVARINGVITATGTIAAGAFSLGTITDIGATSAFTYELQFNAANKRFDLVRVYANACAAATSPSGAFTCSGAAAIAGPQSLSASGATALSVTLNSETRVDAAQTAFTLTQTGGVGGISFTQSDSGEQIRGAQSGIVASDSGGGAISINVNGTVTGAAGDGISATSDANGSGITITAASVSGASSGIKVMATGTGSVSVSASGSVAGGTGDGIFVDHDGTGATSVAVSGSVSGGSGNGVAAIRMDVSSGRAATVSLNSGASVGAAGRNAIIDTAGNAAVTVNSGATVAGKVNLGAGNDTLTFAGGGFLNVTEMDGGAGTDTLTFSGGASGAMSGVAEWETVSIRSGSTVSFGTGAHTLGAGTLTVASGGTLNVGDDSDTGDELTVSGNFAGGGTVTLDANFGSSNSGSDSLTISGNVTGTTTVNLSRIGSGALTAANSVARIEDVISATGTVVEGAFSLGATGIGQSSAFTYELQFDVTAKRFDLVRVSRNACAAVSGTSGTFTCSGANQIGAAQSLSASGATALSVTLNSETPVDTGGTAFSLTQTGGTGGISFTQSATGRAVSAAADGIVANNSGGGAISINVNGSLTASGGDAIRAVNDASGAGIAIIAATVSASASGIVATSSGTGAVSVRATGSVTAGAHGISVRRSAAGRVDIAVSGAVAGGSGAAHAAIATDAPSTSAVRIALNSGAAALGAGDSHAIRGGAGDSEVTVAAGARIAGRISLGSGADTLAFAGGSFEAVTRMDGGDGAGDTLRFGAGSGSLHNDIAGSSGEGLKGWESVIVESGAAISGAVKLADDSGNLTFDGAAIDGITSLDGGGGSANTLAFNNVSGSLAASVLTGWEDVVIGAGSRVRLTGPRLPRTAAARLSVTGTLAFGTATAANDTFTVQGDFAGSGAVAIDANFAAPENGDPTADMLVIEGSATGTTAIAINDLTPDDGTVPGDDIEVVTVSGGADASAFALAGTVIKGSYFYGLAHVPDETGDGVKFVLRPGSGTSDAGAVLRLAPAAIAGGFARTAALAARSAARMRSAAGSGIGAPMTLTERLGKLIGQDAARMGGGARSLWARFYSDSQSSDAADGFGESEVDSAGVVIGADLLSREAAGGNWIAGLTVQYGSVSAEAKGAGGTGRQESTGYGFGAAASWFGADGLYANAAAQFGSFEADYSADSTGVIKNGVGGGTSSAAFEVGRRFAARGAMTLVPKGRLGWSSVSSDKFTSEDGVEIDLGTSSVAEASVGVAAEFGLSKGGVRVSGALSRRLGDPDGVVVGGQTVAQAGPDGWMELGFGGSFDVDANSVLFLDGAYRAGGDSTGLSLSGGLKFNW